MILHVAITDVAGDTQERAVKALQDAGIEVYRAWTEKTPFDNWEDEETVRPSA